jgi:hypothetical protein
MNIALDPINRTGITVDQYRERFGKELENDGKEASRQEALCPVCLQSLGLKAVLAPMRRYTIFSHKPRSNFCPLKKPAGKKYEVLPPASYNPHVAQNLRASFFVNWRYHWLQFKSYLGAADIKDFIDVVRFADKKHLWRYQGILENEIPYVLLVLKHFAPVINHKGEVFRKSWVSCWFEGSLQSLGDFWNKRSVAPARIVRLSYDYPKNETATNIMNNDHLTSIDPVVLNITFLPSSGSTVTPPNVPAFVVKKMNAAFPGDAF